MNTLTVFSPRTGSTFTNELLSFKNNNVDLDEFLSSNIRMGTRAMLVENIPSDIIDELRRLRNKYSGYNPHKTKFLHKINEFGYNWSAKCFVNNNLDTAKYLLEELTSGNTGLFYTKRKDVKAQCWSFMMAEHRDKHLSDDFTKYSSYVHTNNRPYKKIEPSKLDSRVVNRSVSTVVSSRNNVEELYNEFGGTVICYEDTLAKEDYSILGVTQPILDEYRKLRVHMTKPRYVHPSEYFTNWKQVDEMIETLM